MQALAVTATSHQSELGTWGSIIRQPAPHLLVHTQRYEGYYQDLHGDTKQLHTPIGRVPVIITFETPFTHLDPERPDAPPASTQSFVAGMHDRHSMSDSRGPTSGIQVNFTPIGAYQLLGLPMHSITNRVVDLEDIWGASARLLRQRLIDAETWEQRFDVMDAFITRRLALGRVASEGVAWAWQQLNTTSGAVPIGELSSELGWSRKRLVASFRDEVGLPPKTVGRVLRFQRATRVLDADRSPDWAKLAFDCGYYDQSHLIRDFNEFAGASPTEYVARMLPDRGGVAAN
jgi:AraC-like DNA-binding protein